MPAPIEHKPTVIEHNGVARALQVIRDAAATSAREWADEIANGNSSYGRDITFAEARASHIVGLIMAMNRLASS